MQEPNDEEEGAQLPHGSGSRVRPTEDETEFVIEYKVNHEDEISQVLEALKL